MDLRDRQTGRKVYKFPLQINLPRLGCDIHRDLARGIPDSDLPLIVQATVERSSSEQAEELERLINDLWRTSYGAAIQQEGMLDMNIYGGVVYQIRWEPWKRLLPYRTAVRKIPSPGNIKPTWSRYEPWRMSSCYIGFLISREEAEEQYNVRVPANLTEVLYLERWDTQGWWVHVHGQIPNMTWGDRKWVLAGENPFGFVPVYYIPHERTTELFGDSAVEGQQELTRDFNSRAANVSDIVRATRPGLLSGHDIQRNPEVKRIDHKGTVLTHYIDLGPTRGVQGAQPPSLDSLPIPNVPEGIAGFPDTLLTWWMMVKRISPASFGQDDTQSGRITGPATANRMWTSIAHSSTERINYTTGKCLIDQDLVSVLKVKAGALEELGVSLSTDLSGVDPVSLRIMQRWPPMIPLDKQQLHSDLIEELREGGASIERYLRSKGVEDVEVEKQRIMAWLEWLAENEAKSRPVIGGLSGAQNQSTNK
jgi:hypothetical protein